MLALSIYLSVYLHLYPSIYLFIIDLLVHLSTGFPIFLACLACLLDKDFAKPYLFIYAHDFFHHEEFSMITLKVIISIFMQNSASYSGFRVKGCKLFQEINFAVITVLC